MIKVFMPGEKIDFKDNTYFTKGARLFMLDGDKENCVKRFYRRIGGGYVTEDIFAIFEKRIVRINSRWAN